ncbi:MAG: hypothetical protein GTO60_11670, partial [Gammaproteobacteria bacterium]|nr:hypothetical protein [Gammaproteobacteria bacterium]NIN62267.1 hypothetical protein [Gammaproteobacteria bacterium]NIO62988.1 hypothetical protein [Gammaproteobacteria bacterium]NIQ19950.1 hypothetical protein [Gammaproteobacteria bacterium]NIT06096.1 hypothetical protein [Gammaproteobacteria bacterium]
GVILAQAGQVNLVSGNQVTMDFDGDGLMQFTVDKEVLENAEALDSAVNNAGEIRAEGGSVLLTGSAASEVFTQVVNNDGVISAGRIENEGGVIRLVGLGTGSTVVNTGTIDVSAADATSDGGTIEISAHNVNNSGTLKADSFGGVGGNIGIESRDTTLVTDIAVVSAYSADDKGGTVQILGDKVGLLDASSVSVSGALGGGEVLIGGDFQGNNPEIQNASRTFVGTDVSIEADATDNGDGGKVIIWADEVTRYYGEVSANGGIESGDGGFVEISGYESLDFNGDVLLGSVDGHGGTLLLDPVTINITNDATDNSPQSNVNFGDAGPTSITVGTLENTGTPGTDIILQATQTITIDDLTNPVTGGDIDLLPGVSLTLQTRNASGEGAGGITFTDSNDAIIAQGGGNITLQAGTDGADGASLTTIGDLTTDTGNITLLAADDIDVDGSIDAGTGGITLTATDGIIDVVGTLDSTASAISLAAGSNIFLGSKTTTTGVITLDATGTLTLDGNADITSNNNDINITASDYITNNPNNTDIDAGTASVTMTASSGDLSVGNLQAGEFNVSNTELSKIIANTTNFETINPGNIFIDGVTSLATNGDITLTSGDAVIFSSANTFPNTLTVSANGTITDLAGTALSVTNLADLSGSSITLGDDAGDTTDFGTLTFNSTGAVSITEDSDTVITGSNTADSLNLVSGGALTDLAGTSLSVTNLADLSGSSITLGDDAGDTTDFG